MSANRSTNTAKRQRRALAYRLSAEASLLHGNGTMMLSGRDMEMIYIDRAYYKDGLWSREEWCMAFCLLAALVEAGDA